MLRKDSRQTILNNLNNPHPTHPKVDLRYLLDNEIEFLLENGDEEDKTYAFKLETIKTNLEIFSFQEIKALIQ